ncbi:MAG TPA: PINc/VapC family ATPase [Candidatus Nanoarchaeia archaeon]|nr:PINc/VapC family ATPase [Candidatus Nanoarchaeia archaeon]
MKKRKISVKRKIKPVAGVHNVTKLVADTSVIIEGVISQRLKQKQLTFKTLIVHEAVLHELEHQANQGRETGYLGIDEIKRLREMSKDYKFTIVYTGKKPEAFDIAQSRSGGIDSLIRDVAYLSQATLITADRVQSLIAQSKGVAVIFVEFEFQRLHPKPLRIEQYFDEQTMSVHLRENCVPAAKRGKPGSWQYVEVAGTALLREDLRDMAKEIVEACGMRRDGFVEIDRKGSTIAQLGNFRVVITKPPLSDGWEITVVRPITKLAFADYHMSQKLAQRLLNQAEGVLIAGAPGNGKSTFAQALAEHYASLQKVVKTIEAPRDLQVSERITQYAISHSSTQEIHDILLLVRPDYTIYDEMRNTEDFALYTDLRLAGVGMVGIVHGNKPIDAIQRFIGRVELGMIPQIVDTAIFIKDGQIAKVFSISMEVKVPSGMTEADLARPIVTITDFENGKLEYEIYTYGDATVVIPVKESQTNVGIFALAAESISREFRKYVDKVKVEMLSGNKATVFVPEHAIGALIGKGGSNISQLEKKLGISLDIQELDARSRDTRETHTKEEWFEPERSSPATIDFQSSISKSSVKLFLAEQYANKSVNLYIGDDYCMTVKVGHGGLIKIKKGNKIAKLLAQAIENGLLRVKV